MSLNIQVPDVETDLKARIAVIGVGGAGGNAVNNMIASGLEGVEFISANTDAQALRLSQAPAKIQLGANLTSGLGAGSRAEIGRAAAEEAADEIGSHLEGIHMLFITAGMGGGTGTGAAPVIARLARDRGILTVAVVTKPFAFEGQHRTRIAEGGLKELRPYADTLIVIANENLFQVITEKTPFAAAFAIVDSILHGGVRGITDLIVKPGLVNLDFADIRVIMAEMGQAQIGSGEGEGEDRALTAAEAAIANPLLEDVSMCGARGVLINITGGEDMTLYEVQQVADRIKREVDSQAHMIFGSVIDPNLNGRVRVAVVATGIDLHPSQDVTADSARDIQDIPEKIALGDQLGHSVGVEKPARQSWSGWSFVKRYLSGKAAASPLDATDDQREEEEIILPKDLLGQEMESRRSDQGHHASLRSDADLFGQSMSPAKTSQKDNSHRDGRAALSASLSARNREQDILEIPAFLRRQHD